VRITRRTLLLLTLFLTSVYASWQGIGVSYAVSESPRPADCVSNTVTQTSFQTSSATETGETNISVPPPYLPAGLADSGDISSPRITSYSESDWALLKINALPAIRTGNDDSPVLVAVLDTGIDQDHEELSGRVINGIDLAGTATVDDIYGHGTAVAGIIAAADDGTGVTGLVPETRLINVKVADDKGKCRLSALVEGIVWAVDNGAKVINISIELNETTPALKEAVDYAWKSGAVIIAAAGNGGDSQPAYPAAYENCIAVTAIRENDTLAPLANYGDWVDVAAPGFNIYTILPDNGYGYKHGTSFAAAYVSGLAALLFPMMTDTNGDGNVNDEVRRAIESGCDAIDIAGTGYGNIDVAGSLAEIS
jgi:thermitase